MSDQSATARIRDLERLLHQAEDEIRDLRAERAALYARLHGRPALLAGHESREVVLELP
ncbi:hypothetical protein [Streptacidiphilus monticola]|uniref:Uncharacterized protein n=1 Tax=Streptacidiphilus monticola TaxID=2161674 RepID=A0ABW1FV55_9ACTN